MYFFLRWWGLADDPVFMWWLSVVGFLVLLFVFAALYDLRLRRRGRRFRDAGGLTADARENRRDMRAWDRGSHGHSGVDLSWTEEARRRRGGGRGG